MNIHFTGHRMDVTSSLKNFTQEKFDKLERHFDKITAINVVFDVEKLRHIAEATILISKGEIHASSEADDMYAAIDLLVDKLDRQLIKHKGKILDHRNHRDDAAKHLEDEAE